MSAPVIPAAIEPTQDDLNRAAAFFEGWSCEGRQLFLIGRLGQQVEADASDATSTQSIREALALYRVHTQMFAAELNAPTGGA